MLTLSHCGERGLLSSCSVQASRGSDFSCCRAWALGCLGSVVVAYGLACPKAHGIFLDQGSNPAVSPALAGEFLATGLPGKSLSLLFVGTVPLLSY